jgi:crotonobetainyl-CoA:carnitine CoA-transferase CaiB-like acyl-CoA transferase
MREGAYDWTVQGLAGWQSVTGEPGGPPSKSGLSLADYCGGYVAAIAILGGVWRARRDGVGADLDLSLFETSLAQLAYLSTWVASHGYEPQRRPNSAHQSIVPFQNFETADGWLVVACPKQSLWERLCDAIGRPDLLADEHYESFAMRDRNRDELLGTLGEIFRSGTTAHWLNQLGERGVPCSRINNISEALRDPQVAFRGGVIETDHSVLGKVRQVVSPMRYGDYSPPTERGPFRGEDTAAVLTELCGYTEEQVGQFARDGVFGEGVPGVASPRGLDPGTGANRAD